MGIEPTALAWEARVLPLYDARARGPRNSTTGARRRSSRDGRSPLASAAQYRTWFTTAPRRLTAVTLFGRAPVLGLRNTYPWPTNNERRTRRGQRARGGLRIGIHGTRARAWLTTSIRLLIVDEDGAVADFVGKVARNVGYAVASADVGRAVRAVARVVPAVADHDGAAPARHRRRRAAALARGARAARPTSC